MRVRWKVFDDHDEGGSMKALVFVSRAIANANNNYRVRSGHEAKAKCL